MRGVGVDDEALFMHPPVAAQWETAARSLFLNVDILEVERHIMHIHYGPLFSARDEPSSVRHKRARGGWGGGAGS